jgi:hypothetical protein
MMACLKDELDSIEHPWKAQDCCVRYVYCDMNEISLGTLTTNLDAAYRCLAHIVHLTAKHIVQAFSQDGPLMESDFPADTSPADIDEDSETSYASGDTIGKLWEFINQVSDL